MSKGSLNAITSDDIHVIILDVRFLVFCGSRVPEVFGLQIIPVAIKSVLTGCNSAPEYGDPRRPSACLG